MTVHTFQLLYDSTSSLSSSNGGNNFQIPLQGCYDIYLRSVDMASTSNFQLSVRSPQLRTSFTCSNTTGTDGTQTILNLPPLSNQFLLIHSSGVPAVTNPILFPRVFLQNTIQMYIVGMFTNLPLSAGEVVCFTFEAHSVDTVIDSKTYLPPF